MMRFMAILMLLLMLSSPAYSADQWDKADPAGTANISDIDTIIQENNSATDRMLRNYRNGCNVIYVNANQVNILTPCEIMICNSGGTDCEMRRASADVNVTWADIDTGSESSGAVTQYYVYVTADTDVEGFVEKVSLSSSAPSGATKYRKIGYLTNNASNNIVSVGNIPGGNVSNTVTVIGTSDISTTSTSYDDMTDMVVYFVSSGRPVEYLFNAPVNTIQNGRWSVTFDVDGTDVGGQLFSSGASTNYYPAATTIYYLDVDGLAAGTHTVKVQWKDSTTGTTIYQEGATEGNRVLTVREL